ncbi:hypothetical protein SDC9_156853 [bioreactor metagenome]|uniref:Uncharacterized protein n=1 Tax=bioreactor metagenome TaxID=1076179 RepID=A0A645F7R0_9ZZZZ
MIDYIRIGRFEFEENGESCAFVEWSAKGIRRLINRAANQNLIAATSNSFTAITKRLSEEKKLAIREIFLKLSTSSISTEEEWKQIIPILEDILKEFELTVNDKTKKFLLWTNETVLSDIDQGTMPQALPNHYVYQEKEGGRCVDLEFGSIHSVKGRTHLATLVLETYLRTHNMRAILKNLCANPPRSYGSNQSRLKCQYVAMTRAKALLCLAMPKEFVDITAQELLQKIGWTIKIVE